MTDHDPPSVFRSSSISYLRIPSPDPTASATFYEQVFGWQTEATGSGDARFADGSGHVIGHFQSDLAPAGAAGVRPYVYVDDLEATLSRAVEAGGETETPPYAEGNLRVATLRDPAGNVIGVWHSPS
jgi:uncharacterized protein